jgi:hypothetical protein
MQLKHQRLAVYATVGASLLATLGMAVVAANAQSQPTTFEVWYTHGSRDAAVRIMEQEASSKCSVTTPDYSRNGFRFENLRCVPEVASGNTYQACRATVHCTGERRTRPQGGASQQ